MCHLNAHVNVPLYSQDDEPYDAQRREHDDYQNALSRQYKRRRLSASDDITHTKY